MVGRLSAVVDFGVAPGIREARASAVRALNIIVLVLCCIALGSAIMSVILISTELALINVIFFLVYATALLLNGAGKLDAARWVALGCAGLHYLTANVAVGQTASVDLYVVAMAYAPMLAFARSETRKLLGAYAIFLASLLAAQLYLASHTPIYSLPEAGRMPSRLFALVMLSGFSAVTVYYYRAAAISAQIKLYQANQRLHELLVNILPVAIAGRLSKGETPIADAHAEATVLFADLVGFSALSKRLAPAHLVELLNVLFSRFDEAAARFGVEKIKTIGDCYMAATGVLGDTARQTEVMADFALQMLDTVAAVGKEFDQPLKLRIGISTGPVVAGVIGRRKYAYDLWGDTVNLASRMEHDSEGGQIQVTESTYWRLHRNFVFRERGAVDIKGYPNTSVYVLLGRFVAPDDVVPLDPKPVQPTRST
ncbi:MAG TPA: adenylate/guanylate cyclase domain-containing protein [Candidatus Sulfotelmatobacter sp.]|nr:adenylate/guanylate cyclase domain-containing protein [Candidatus Sulfotelmatobacter sp.]